MMLRKTYRFVLQWALFSLFWSGLFIMVAVFSAKPDQKSKRRYGYGTNDFPLTYDPALEDLTKKFEEMVIQLIDLKHKVGQFRFGLSLDLVQDLDLHLDRLLANFEIKTEYNDLKDKLVDQKEELKTVCPEEFLGTTYGYPLYKSGFRRAKDCKKPYQIHELVTILYNVVNSENVLSEDDVIKLVNSTLVSHPGVKIKLATSYHLPRFQNIQLLNSKSAGLSTKNGEIPDGMLWNALIQDVTTPYVYIGQDTAIMESSINFERMIRISELYDVQFVSGSRRKPDGHWNLNCYQFNYKNYSLSIVPGYKQSTSDSCLLCDFAQGPFLAKTQALSHMKFSSKLSGSGLINLSTFLKAKYVKKYGLMSCPDVMANVVEEELAFKEDFLALAKKFSLFSIRLWNGLAFDYNNTDIGKKCEKHPGLVLSPACIEELMGGLEFIFETCDRINAKCQLQEGSLLGALKLSTILPWERDADIAVLSSDFNPLVDALSDHPALGKLKIASRAVPMGDSFTGGSAMIYTESWVIELNGQHELFESKDDDLATKVQVGKLWLPASYNPGLHARNRYGSSIFKHVQHWLTIGKNNGWIEYGERSNFQPCPKSNHHACLDQYQTDGNVQFSDSNRLLN